MKTITFIMTVALSSLTALGAEDTTKPTCPEQKECCKSADKSNACDDTCWLDIETITVEAANGDPLAQYAIAWITENGTGNTPKNPQKAHEMYSKAVPGLEKAAKEGHPTACQALARMYATGKGVEKNPEKAAEIMKWCKECKEKKAADAVNAPSPEASTDTQKSSEM